MLRGYAVKIELIRWEKRPGRDAAFETIQSHYVGGLLEQRAEMCYLRFKKELEAQAGDPTARAPRSEECLSP